MLLPLPPLLLLSTTFHLPGLYSSASAASWDTREPEGKEGEEREEGECGVDFNSVSIRPRRGELQGRGADEGASRSHREVLSEELAYSAEKEAHAAQQATTNAPRKEKERREERSENEKKMGLLSVVLRPLFFN